MTTRFGVATLLGLGLCAVGCQSVAALEGRIRGLEELVKRAEKQGAYECAPEELALASAYLTFARDDLELGDASLAREHLELAEPNAKAAVSLSPAGKCTDTGPSDRDGDGIIDKDDKCPDVPEDKDGVEDDDGCPDDSDSDGDTVIDSRDLCVLEPEDLDTYLDADGCPEFDNDLDTVPDTADRCPDDPEDRDAFEDADGCPDLD
ncbi:MAG: OmpA family protein, partial [Myxococcales bacterium]|nr:OmpA family protein [Myxococcales bacterium]